MEQKDSKGWNCICGRHNEGTNCFCTLCGKPQPAPTSEQLVVAQSITGWQCVCGAHNESGMYCSSCGMARDRQKSTPVPNKNITSKGLSSAGDSGAKIVQDISAEKQVAFSKENVDFINNSANNNVPQSSGRNLKIIGIAASILMLGGITYYMIGSKNLLDSPQPVPITDSQGQSATSTTRLPVTVESTLGGLKIGDTDDKMRQLFGQETKKTRGEMSTFENYRYGNDVIISACFRDTAQKYDYVYRIIAKDNSTLQTDRGIHIGSTIQELLNVYDDNYKKVEQVATPNSVIYSYSFVAPIGNEPGTLEFIVDLKSQRIIAIEMSIPRKNIPFPKDFKSEEKTTAEMAINVLKSYHQAITNRDFQTAYNYFSSDEQKAHGTLESYAQGYTQTLSSEIVEASAKPIRGDTEWEVNYKLKARDREGNRVKVQFFEGTAQIKLRGEKGKIINMESQKVGEKYE